MDALEFISDTFEWIATKFDEAAQALDGIWAVGDVLAAPFYFFADNFQWISELFVTVDDWWEWLKEAFLALPTWDDVIAALKATFPIIEKTWSDIEDLIVAKLNELELPELPTWSEIFDHIEDMCVSTWDILAHTWSDIEDLIPTWDDLKPAWFPTSLDELVTLIMDKLPPIPTVDNIIEWVSDAFESILDRLFREEG